ncbi:MAG: hypothetical protein QOH30_2785 [Baekduia sp.]|jgi:hypothetical protein|nr:hypothetical protein [Baekduia sp.]
MSKLRSMTVAFCLLAIAVPAAIAATSHRHQSLLPKGWAHHYGLAVGSVKADTDHDRLSNLREYRLHTNPRRKDTDRDGLTDGQEVLRYHTGPRRKDTDVDGLTDGAEVRKYHTNPRKKDTDGDGFTDGAEVKAGSDPRKKSSVPAAAKGAQPGAAAPGATSTATAGVPAPGAPAGAAPGTPGGTGIGTTGPTPTPIPTPPATPATCNRTATTATFGAQFAAATSGQTVCLAAGGYGTFKGAAKPGPVFVIPQPGAAVSMAVDFGAASNIILDGLTITGATLTGATNNITIRNSTFTGSLMFDRLANANVLLDHNTHNNIMTCASCDPARIHGNYDSPTASGVTVMNSVLSGGNSDGIQTGVGMNIINNEFSNIKETGPSDPAHSDAMQLIGATGVLVRGNYVHDTASGIVAYDGIDHATIEDNVVDIARTAGIELYSDNGSTVRHNTVVYRPTGCYAGNVPCGFIDINRKSADPAGSGTTVIDNITSGVTLENGSTVATRNHNMVRQGVASGDFTGTPAYVGGAHPTVATGFRLTAGSPGHGRASDGQDVGIR